MVFTKRKECNELKGQEASSVGWVLDEADHDALSRQAVRKVLTSYSQQSVALRYTEVYYEAMASKQFKL